MLQHPEGFKRAALLWCGLAVQGAHARHVPVVGVACVTGGTCSSTHWFARALIVVLRVALVFGTAVAATTP